MYNTIKLIPFLSSIVAAASCLAHVVNDNGITELVENRKPDERIILRVPDINGYTTLKCDLHMHTVFSDGLVWPSIRVEEAWKEGLDAIAITDHLEYSPHQNDIPVSHNRPYEIAKSAADLTNILLIRGSEITRNTPPGHFNAIFVSDSSILQTEKEQGNFQLDKIAIDKAAQQNAFIFWNHPGWKTDTIDGSYEWIDFISQIHREGKLHGIEVINGFKFHRKSLDWALEHNIAVLGTSDIHNLTAHDYDMEKGVTRSMTLIFARNRSIEAIREALEEGRTVAWSTKLLAGREKWVRALYQASVSIEPIYRTDGRGRAYAEIKNESDFHFMLVRVDNSKSSWPEKIMLNPGTSQILRCNIKSDGNAAEYIVENAYTGGYENLVVKLQLAD